MNIRSRILRTSVLAVVGLLLAGAASADEIRVMTSGAFTAAYLQLVPEFERATRHTVVTTFGASMGSGPTTIPSRLQRGEPADVVILAGSALDELVRQGKVVAGSRVDLVRSRIGMAVRAGAPRPDITSVEALTRTLLRAASVGVSSSASGVYLSTVLFPRLGVADELKSKTKISEGAVGPFIASGAVEIGFQQISELLPEPGIDYVGPLPAAVQRETVFAAGIVSGAHAPEAARALLTFFSSPAAAPVITKTGLEPIAAR